MVVASAAILLGSSALVAAQAGAAPGGVSASAISNPGAVSVAMKITLSENILAVPTDVGPMTGNLTGTVDAAGHLSFPKASINFAAATLQVAGNPTVLKVVPVADWTGTIDPSSGNINLKATASVLFTSSLLGAVNCPLGPSTFNLFGNSYKVATGKASLSDPSFLTPALAPNTAGCNGAEQTVNGAIGLPASGVANAGLTFSPKLTGVGITVTTTTGAPTTTTTTVAAPVTTGVPVTAAATTTDPNQLPRTGSSTMPLALIGGGFVLGGLALVTRRKPRSA